MSTDAQKRASLKYNVNNTTRVYVQLNNKTDADVIAKLNTVESKNGYIKELIRRDIRHESK